MSPWHTFALPHGTRRVLTTESANPTKDRKRKRDDDDSVEAEDNDSASGTTSRKSISLSRTANKPPDQHNISGLGADEEIPLHPFPHAPQPQKTTVLDRVRHGLHSLDPPLAHLDPSWYEPSSKHNAGEHAKEGLREKHLANLTTLLHHMLLKGDFERAGRAWALLLRSGRFTKSIKSNTGYLSMDVTARNRWGIGAELLMRNTQNNGHVRNSAYMQGTDEQSENMHNFSEEGFRAARGYYERLIVQYPVHHQRKGPSATDFYAAMFSLWIYEASQRSKSAEQSLASGERESSTSPAFGQSLSDEDAEDDRDRRLRAVKARELGDARMIASRLDDVIGAPPLDKNAELLQIRAMVALWVGTLQGGRAQETAFERAKDLLLRSRANGGTLWEGVEHIVEEDDW